MVESLPTLLLPSSSLPSTSRRSAPCRAPLDVPSLLMDPARKEISRRLRRSMERYRGGRFETGENGGASGMLFFVDPDGRKWFIGGFNGDNAGLVTVLNDLLAALTPQP